MTRAAVLAVGASVNTVHTRGKGVADRRYSSLTDRCRSRLTRHGRNDLCRRVQPTATATASLEMKPFEHAARTARLEREVARDGILDNRDREA